MGTQTCRRRIHRQYRHTAPGHLRRVLTPRFWAEAEAFCRQRRGAVWSAGGGARWSLCWLGTVALIMGWVHAPTLTDAFRRARQIAIGLRRGRRRPGGSYQGFMGALKRLPRAMVGFFRAYLQRRLRVAAGRHWRVCGWPAFTVDGSRIAVPRTVANEQAFGVGGKAGGTPQRWLTVILHMGTEVLWDWCVGPADASERRHLRMLLRRLPPGSLIVADAGFVGYDLIRAVLRAGHHLLVRAGANVRLLTLPGARIEVQSGSVYLWPTTRRPCPALQLRLMWVRDRDQRGRGRRMALLTTVLDPTALSCTAARTLYRMRWGVEVFYRHYKRTLDHWKLRSRTPKMAELELTWGLCGMLLLQVMTAAILHGSGILATQVSFSQTLRVMRRAFTAILRRVVWRGFERAVRNALRDTYCRHGPKQARYGPRKKRCKPPGLPKLRRLTDTELEELTVHKAAA
jgi:hypothetical protein